MGRPIEHGPETRRRLLEAAGRLLAEEGPGAVTVRRLATDVGTTTRAVYSLFGGKQGLFSAMYDEGSDLMVRYHEAVPPSVDPLDELLPLAMAYRRAAREQPNLYGLIFEGSAPGFTPTHGQVDYVRRSFRRAYDALRRGADLGLVGELDPEGVARQGFALVHGLASLEIHGLLGPPAAAEAVWRDGIATFVAGLRARARPSLSGARASAGPPAGRRSPGGGR